MGIGFPPSTGVDDRDRFSSGMSSAVVRPATPPPTTWGLPSLDRILPGVELADDVLGDEDLVRCPSLVEGVLSEDGVAGCFIVDLSKLLNVN